MIPAVARGLYLSTIAFCSASFSFKAAVAIAYAEASGVALTGSSSCTFLLVTKGVLLSVPAK